MRYFFLSCLCPLLCWGEPNQWETKSEDESLFLNRIADFWEEGEYQIAKNQIHEFLALYPNSPFADSLSSALGDLFLREKNYPSALEYYAKVTDPQVAARIFPHRIQCLYAMQWYSVLADECEAFIQKNPSADLQITYYLATALYHQLINTESEALYDLAKRATPYFETLFSSSLKNEIAAPYAHLLCLQKEFPKAADIYLAVAKAEGSEEMLFQAALIQAEYDKELSLKTFETIQNIKPESAYNCLVLSFDLQKYEDIINTRETILQTIPPERVPMAHLFFGRSQYALRKYQEACSELTMYIETQIAPNETLHSALVTLLQASIHNQDLDTLNQAIDKMDSFYPQDESLLDGRFSKALLLREKNQLQLAKQELENLPQNKPEILLELIHICNQMNDWEQARNKALTYLSQFPDEPQLPLVKKYLIYASTEIANTSVEGKRQLISDLKNLGGAPYLLAKTLFALKEYKEALPILLEITEEENSSDVYLLSALCYRDGFDDLQNFCVFGEKVFTSANRSIDEGALHASLYNAYLELSHSDETLIAKAAKHLFQAFQAQTPISTQNLLWLSERFIAEGNTSEATSVLEHIVQTSKEPSAMFALSKIYAQGNRFDQAASLLESLLSTSYTNESALLLGEVYVASGKTQEAQEIFAKICQEKSSLKTYSGASACLQNARLQIGSENPQVEQVLSQYKNLVLQKNLSNEPLYLEAALDYISLQTRNHENDQEKKLALLQKTKRDFENTEDLLSKDYHAARSQLAKQDAIYQSYMNFLEAEILNTQSFLEKDGEEQKELQARAKDLLLKIVEEKAHPALVDRANQCLNQ